YASASKRQQQLQELETLVPKLVEGDVVRITMNAHRTTLGENAYYTQIPVEQRPATLAAWRHAKLKEQLGDYLPPERDKVEYMDTKEGLYRTMLRSVKHVVVGALQPRSELMPFPVLSSAYEDQHGMITAAFAVIPTGRQDEFRQRTGWDRWDH